MRLSYSPHSLLFKVPFGIATGTRLSTPVVFTQLHYQNLIGYGEAAMPPYTGENHQTVLSFLARAATVLQSYTSPSLLQDIIAEIDLIADNNTAAKASVDIALHDLLGKIANKPLHQILNLDQNGTPYTTYTIGMGETELLHQKIIEATEYPFLKIKLGGTKEDKHLVDKIRTFTNKPLFVDINQGWKDKHYALDMIGWLKEQGSIVVEQPLPKANLEDMQWLKARSELPLIADEAVQRLSDIDAVKHAYDGINIKLMKCTGLYEAQKMITAARKHDLKIMLGCMSESSCGVSAAAQLSPLVDWADLDGPLLIKNDYFEGITFKAGKIILSKLPGIGIVPKVHT